MVRQIIYDSGFVKSVKKLSPKVQDKFKKLELTFQADPFSPQLKTHKLHGKLKNYYAFSISHKYRVIFKLISDQVIALVEIGTHEIYK